MSGQVSERGKPNGSLMCVGNVISKWNYNGRRCEQGRECKMGVILMYILNVCSKCK